MSLIKISNLTFAYDDGGGDVFCDVSMQIDTDWRLGFCGRNGRGKTTLLQLLMGRHEHGGTISANVNFEYFPFFVEDKEKTTQEILEGIVPDVQSWQIQKELFKLDVSPDVLYRPFNTLSGGEQTKALLAGLFLKDNNFLLIDEPTNHLDADARKRVADYLNEKKGFIVVSHDRQFLDGCVDHILSINKTDIELESGNFSAWLQNKEARDNFERRENEKLISEIERLKEAAKRKSDWSDAAEKMKKGQGPCDRGFVGAKAAKTMKTAKTIEKRRNQAAEDKSKLLKNIETQEEIFVSPLTHHSRRLAEAKGLKVCLQDKLIFEGINFSLEQGDRICVSGKNGSGKSTLLKLLARQELAYSGYLSLASGLIVSYVPQDTTRIAGGLDDLASERGVDKTRLKTMLRKMDFDRGLFDMDIKSFSAGQKKKVLLALSLSQEAHLYIWDEPLNFIDIFSRMQIEKLILSCKPTLIFVEHDRAFCDLVSTKTICLE